MFTSTRRVIKFAFQNFWRNIWLSVITVSMLVLTLLVVNIVISLHVLGGQAVKQIEDKIDITVTFQPGASDQTVGEVRSYLASLNQVTNIDSVSSDQALNDFKEQHKNDPQILRSLDEVGENPFGPTLIVSARSSQDFPFILEALENPSFASDIETKNFIDHEALIGKVNGLTGRLKEFGAILAGIFAAIAILIIFNTIRVAIFAYREEIGIMKLVGASNWFVRTPFLLESIIYSILSVAITAAIVFPIIVLVEPTLVRFFDGNSVGLLDFFKNNWLVVFGSQLVVLIALNMISSAMAMGKYLRT